MQDAVAVVSDRCIVPAMRAGLPRELALTPLFSRELALTPLLLEMALGSDLMNTALEGYGLLKVSGRNRGVEGCRSPGRPLRRRHSRPSATPAE